MKRTVICEISNGHTLHQQEGLIEFMNLQTDLDGVNFTGVRTETNQMVVLADGAQDEEFKKRAFNKLKLTSATLYLVENPSKYEN